MKNSTGLKVFSLVFFSSTFFVVMILIFMMSPSVKMSSVNPALFLLISNLSEYHYIISNQKVKTFKLKILKEKYNEKKRLEIYH